MLAPLSWFDANWFSLVQTISIVIGLVFAGASLRRDTRSRRLTNLITLKQEHRELWDTIHAKPQYARILKPDVDLIAEPITLEEETFLRQLIVHVATAWELIQDGTPLNPDGFRADVKAFFALPIPRWAWERVKEAQNPAFAKFMQSALSARKARGEGAQKAAQKDEHD